MKKNEAKTLARAHFATGKRDGERFPFNPGPPSNPDAANFYGHFRVGQARRLRRFATQTERIRTKDGAEGLWMWLNSQKLPGWLRRRAFGK